MIEDAELLRRYVEEHSEEAFAELVRRHVDLVYGAAFRRTDGDAHLAKDVVQLVFSRLAQNASALRRHTLLAGWLYVATRHAASTVCRTERRRRTREQEAFIMQSSSSETPADWSRLRPELDSVIDQLNDHDRDAILLRFFENRPFADIGATLRISEDAARMRVERALERLRALLVKRGVSSTAAALAGVLTTQAAMAAPAGMATSVTGGALAVATAGSMGPLTTLISFMSTSKLVATAAGILLVTALGFSGREIYARHEAQSAFADRQRETEALRSRLNVLAERRDAVARENAELQVALQAARAAPRPQSDTKNSADPFLARHPEVKALILEQYRTQVAGEYRLLFKELGLTDAEIERFKDIGAQYVSGSIEGADGERLNYSFGSTAGTKQQLIALLGDERYRQYLQFDRMQASALRLTTELAGGFFDTPTPLTVVQGEKLRRLLAESRLATADLPGGRFPFDWDAIMPRATQFLSAPQMAALESYQAYDEYDRAAVMHLRSKQPAAAEKASTAPKR